jgi:hypothetical protein
MRTRAPLLTILIVTFMIGAPRSLAAWDGPIAAEIPFDFVVAGHTFPAAEYVFDVASTGAADVLTIRSRDGRDQLLFDTDELAAKEDPKAIEVVFDKVGDKSYLTEVWGLESSGRRVRQAIDKGPLARATLDARRHISAVRVSSTSPAPTGKATR